MNTIYDIPNGILTCIAEKNEYSVVEISKNQVVIRMSEDREIHDLSFCFYLLEKQGYENVGPIRVREVDSQKDEFAFLKRFEIIDDVFAGIYDKVINQYQRYILLKLDSEDNYFSKELVGYPCEKDGAFSKDYEEWKSKPERKEKVNGLLEKIEDFNGEISVSLETPNLIKRFVAGEIQIPFKKKIDRVYIGNAFCHNLFPQNQVLLSALEYAKEHEMDITVVLTYLRENLINFQKEKIEFLAKWCRDNNTTIEIEVNDFGYFEMLEGYDCFELLYGRLLNKRRKDPRYIYKSGWDKLNKERMENSVNDEAFQLFLEKYEIKRYEMEACGYEIKTIIGKTDLHLPFYQTNTAQFCPLYALCKNGDRGKQELVINCPYYCETNHIMYPEHLNMLGKYNSLFGLDTRPEAIQDGVDRIVWNFLD